MSGDRIQKKETLIMNKTYLENCSETILKLKDNCDVIEAMAIEISKLKKRNNKILIAGNGGSCADAEHFAGELLCTFKDRNRSAIPAALLSNNASALTAWSNDFEFDTFFKRQVMALGTEGDILFLITTGGGDRASGASMNLVFAAEEAKKLGIQVFSISGKGGGILRDLSEMCVVVDSNITSHIQEAHIAIIHMICLHLDKLENKRV